ncbi:PKD domain-containing protein [Parafilimonas sp.]|uniref:PKD domain-containing protein n=1 Tax=Parafilimonas sp. TaxID=1969739 RepID=UPI0039E2CAD9
MNKPTKFLLALVALCFCVKTNAQLNADFTSSISGGCSPLVVDFTDISSGDPTVWYWDLGNGTTSTNQNPSAVYVTPGSYTVKLHITNSQGEDSIVKTNYVVVYDNPSVDFSGSPTQGCVPFDVSFTDKSTPGSGSTDSWIWDFGDGVTSTEQNPVHTYTVVDSFDVTLTVTNSFGCQQFISEPAYVVADGLIQAKFTYDYNSACTEPVTVEFSNASQSTQTLSYEWDFGDGSALSAEKDPEHTYTTTGDFTVTLVASNNIGCTSTFTQNITIGKSKSDFTYTTACLNAPITFTDSSSLTPLSEKWNFGDGATATGDTVTHTYTGQGNYTVKLVADFGGCSASVQKTISIEAEPEAAFTVSGNYYSCSYPATIQFSNNSTNATSYKWIFGSTATSDSANPAYTYTKAGKYPVTLIAFNANGCSDTLVKSDYIQIGAPQIKSIKNLPFQGCAPQTLTLTPVIDTGYTISSYSWDFGDGTTSNAATPVHAYKEAGVYNVRLIITSKEGCSDTLLIKNAVSLSTKPNADFTASPTDACASASIQFTDASTGDISEWIWNFGDGETSLEQNPLYVYDTIGYFNVSLVVGKYKCYDTIVKKAYIHTTPPVAGYNIIYDCSTPYLYRFKDTSAGATTWLWDFGDGATSTTQNPSHTYSATGTFYVTLTVSNGTCQSIRVDTIQVADEHPVVQYNFVSSSTCKYDSLRFSISNYDAAGIQSFQWNFGDGTIVNKKQYDSVVYHVYDSTATYAPYLIVKDVNQCVDTIQNSVSVKVGGPTAAFTNKEGDCLNSTISFEDASTPEPGSSIKTWIWDYGDNTTPDTLTGGPFSHTYTTKGDFDVWLKVIDNNNCYDTATYNNLSITQPVAAFSAGDTIKCSGNNIKFTDSSEGTSLQYAWDFGDGGTSTLQSPSHKYTSNNTYSVKLVIEDKNGCIDSLLKPQYITIANAAAAFSITDSLFVCPPALVAPVNTSKNYKSLLWDFGDGNTSEEITPQHYYTKAGTFDLKLTVYGYGSCADSLSKEIIVKGPKATFTYTPLTGCDAIAAKFSAKGENVAKYIWDFGNGEVLTTTDTLVQYSYIEAGKYLPKLVIEDTSGCRVAIINGDTITVASAEAKFNTQRITGVCDSSLIDFTDASNVAYDQITAYTWQFGDGDSTTESNPQHYYDTEGQYNASLHIATSIGCTSDYTLPVDIDIDESPGISAVIPASACVNDSISLSATANSDSPAINAWQWDVGDGNQFSDSNITHAYTSAGDYTVTVSATTKAGCSDTVTQKLLIAPLPSTDAGNNVIICLDQSTTLQATGADKYSWVSDASLSCLNCASPTASPRESTVFYVTGTSSYGCEASDSVTVEVKQPTTITASAPDTACAGTTISLIASGAETYKWSPASLVKNSTDSVTTSAPTSPTTFTVIGSDSQGCFSDTASLYVNVFPIPTIQVPDSVINIIGGNSYQINATGSADVTTWLWKPAINISCTDCPNPVISPKQSTFYVVNASNAAGCYSEKIVRANVVCATESNLFIPNTFSPNGDGANDYFYPRGKGLMTIKSIRIFNRLGNLVFERSNFPVNQQSYGWDGNYAGRALPADVYIYIVEITCENGQKISSKGNVTLLR